MTTLREDMAGLKCDACWKVEEGHDCLSPIVYVCGCQRCMREDEREKFHACADPEHVRAVTVRHYRVRGREAIWYKT